MNKKNKTSNTGKIKKEISNHKGDDLKETIDFRNQVLSALRSNIQIPPNISSVMADINKNHLDIQKNIKDENAGINADSIQNVAENPNGNFNAIIKQKPLNEKEVSLLRSKCSEYLNNFVIFGYDIAGERVIISQSLTNQDRDAIVNMSSQIPIVLSQILNGRPNDFPFPL